MDSANLDSTKTPYNKVVKNKWRRIPDSDVDLVKMKLTSKTHVHSMYEQTRETCVKSARIGREFVATKPHTLIQLKSSKQPDPWEQ